MRTRRLMAAIERALEEFDAYLREALRGDAPPERHRRLRPQPRQPRPYPPGFVSFRDAAALLGVAPAHFSRLMDQDAIAHEIKADRYMIKRADVKAYLAANMDTIPPPDSDVPRLAHSELEAERILGISRVELRRLLRDGVIAYSGNRQRMAIPRSEIERYRRLKNSEAK